MEFEKTTYPCGHSSDCDLDLNCPECQQFFLKWSVKSALFVLLGSTTVLLYFWSPDILPNLLFASIIALSAICLSAILRNRERELVVAMMTILPIAVLVQVVFPFGGSPFIAEEYLLVSVLVLLIPLGHSIHLSFKDTQDAQSEETISVWVLVVIVLSIVLTVARWLSVFLAQELDYVFLTQVSDWTGTVADLRLLGFAGVLMIAIIYSVHSAIRTRVNPRRFEGKQYSSNGRWGPISTVSARVKSYFSTLRAIIKTVWGIAKKKIHIAFNIMTRIFHNSVSRTIILSVRLARFVLLVASSIAFILISRLLASSIVKLWMSGGFFGPGIVGWVHLILGIFGVIILTYVLGVLSFKKWGNNPLPTIKLMNVKDIFRDRIEATFGSTKQLIIANESILTSVLQGLVYLTFVLYASWFVIIIIIGITGESVLEGFGLIFFILSLIAVGIWLWGSRDVVEVEDDDQVTIIV